MKEDIERAIRGAQRGRLAEISAAMWKAWSAGAIDDEAAEHLAAMIEARKALPPAPLAPRRTGSRARSPASVERRRAWAASSWLPPRTASMFTPAEQAALGVVMAEIAMTGRCEMSHGAVAGRSGTSVSTVKRALGQARTLGLIAVEERRLTWARSLPNVTTILSPELKTWVATRGRGLRAAKGMWDQGGGVQTGATPKSISNISLSSVSPAGWKAGNRWGNGPGRGGHAKRPVPAPTRPVEPGRSSKRYSRTSAS